MRRWAFFVFLLTLIIHTPSHAQDNPWTRIIPRASFGYGNLSSVYWSPLNGQLAVASETGFQFYDENMLLQGERRFDEPYQGRVIFSPDMNYVAIEEGYALLVRDTQTWEPLLALSDYSAPSWSHDSRHLAIWTGNRLRIWDIATAEITLEVDELISNGGAVQWSPDSQVVAVPGPGAIIMVRTDTGDIVRIHAFDTIRDFDWSADGRYFAVIGLKDPLPPDHDPDEPIVYDVMLMDAVSGDIVRQYSTASGGIVGSRYGADNFIAISPNGRYIAAQLKRWEPRVSEDEVGSIPLQSFNQPLTNTEEFFLYRLFNETLTLAFQVEDDQFLYALLDAWNVGLQYADYDQLYGRTADLKEALELGDIDLAYHFIDLINENASEFPLRPRTSLPTQSQRAQWVDVGMGVWDLETGTPLHDFANPARPLSVVGSVSWSPDGSFFATSRDRTLTVFEADDGTIVDSLRAYIPSTRQTEWTETGDGVIVANGLWDVSGAQPIYQNYVPPPPPPEPLDLSFLEPNPYVFDYEQPPYRWHIVQVYEDRGLVITYEEDIEYPGTPEYEDDEPPEERWVLWNIETGERWEEYYNIDQQTAWLYDLDNAHERDGGNTYYNVKRTTRFVAIGDDEIIDLRTDEKTWLEVDRWEYREVWFGPNGTHIYAYDTDSRFKAYDPVTGALAYETAPAARRSMQFTEDNSRFTVRDNAGNIYVYDALTGELLLEAYTGNSEDQLMWSDDLSILAIGGDNMGIVIYDIATQTRLAVLRGHRSSITSMNWHPTCDLHDVETCRYVMVSSDADGRVLLWGVADSVDYVSDVPEHPAPPSLDLPVADIDFASLEPLWTYVAEGTTYGRAAAHTVRWTEDGIRINNNWYYDTNLNLLEDAVSSDWTQPIEQHPEGMVLYSDGSARNQDDEWVHAGRDTVYDAAFSVDGSRIFTAETADERNTLTGRIRIWSTRSGLQITHFGGGAPGYNQVEVSPDGRWLATATLSYYQSGGRAQIWSLADQSLHRSLIGHTDDIVDLRWHPMSGTIITASYDGTVRLWNTDGEELARWRHRTNAPIAQVSWGQTIDTIIVSAGDDIFVLDTLLLTEMKRFASVGGRTFDWSPDQSQLLCIGSDSVVRIVDYATGQVMAEERRHMPQISAIEWHPDGRTLAVARRDGSIVILDSSTGNVDRVLRPHGARIRSMTWNPAGTRLLLDLRNGPIEIIDGVTGDLQTSIDNQWRRRGVWWSPNGRFVAFGTFPDPEMGVYTATSLVWVHNADTGDANYYFPLDWDDYSWYWNVKPFDLSWSPDGRYLAAFYGGRLRYWDVINQQELGTFMEIGKTLGLSLWRNDVLYFWMTDGHGQIDLNTGTLDYIERDGLPAGTRLRADGLVVLAGDLILDFNTFYPLQDIPIYLDAAAWHPSCWTSECPMVLAVASGGNVTMFGYPQEVQ